MEESVEQSREQSMEHSHELTPEPVAISKAQAQVEQDEKKLLEYVSPRILISISTLFTAIVFSHIYTEV